MRLCRVGAQVSAADGVAGHHAAVRPGDDQAVADGARHRAIQLLADAQPLGVVFALALEAAQPLRSRVR